MVRFSPHTPSVPASERRGFALLITITLLAFLVLLLVSLASLTRVETQVASNNQHISQARANALLALNIALGQLQKYAGPDQRVTTTADILADKDKAGSATPASLYTTTTQVDVKPGSRYWTAVWGNTEQNISYSLRPNQIPPTAGATPNRRGVTPSLLNWLISGNESAVYELRSNNLGGIDGTKTASITYRPGDAIDLTDLTKPKVKGNDAVILVGEKAVGAGATAQKDYVVAPLVTISSPAGSVPGIATAATIGRYAWWVGDEGVKARINLQNGYQALPAADQPAAQINSFLTAQRSAVEFMDRDPVGTATPATVGADFDFRNTGVPNILSGSQLALVNTNSAAQTRLSQAAQYRFHDLTTRSLGVLSDTYAGGLKKDLTADIADTNSIGGNNPGGNRPADDTPVFTPINAATEKYLPTWGHFRSWARTNPSSPTDPVDTNSNDAVKASISPIILFAALGMDYYLGDVEGSPAGRRFKMAFYPMVVLYNPYSWPIKASDYDVGIRFGNYSGATVNAHNTFRIRVKKPADAVYTEYAYVDLNSVSIYPQTPPPVVENSFIRLRLSAQDESGSPRDIPPGQRFAYMLKDVNITEYDHANPPVLHRINKISDKTTNYFTLTSAPLSGLSDPADHIQLFGNEGTSNNSGTNPTSLRYTETSVVLAKSGALATQVWPSTTTDFRHAILNVLPLANGGVGGGYCQLTADPAPTTISSRVLPVSPKAKTVFRLAAINEGRANWSNVDRAGFPYNVTRIRYLADANFRAPYVAATALENADSLSVDHNNGLRQTARPYGTVIRGGATDAGVLAPYPGTNLDFAHYSFGFQDPAMGATVRAVLFDLLESPDRLLSLGQLQHVPWARYSFNTSYPFANSYAPLRIARNLTYRTSGIRRPENLMTSGIMTSATDPLYDLPWHLNRAIWDKYFVSGIPRNLPNTTTPLPNARMEILHSAQGSPAIDNLKYSGVGPNNAYDRAAANLMVKGAFNINSTSEQAWRAVLSGSKGLESNPAYAEAADGVETSIPYPRFSRNMSSLAISDGPYGAYATTMTLPSTTDVDIRGRLQITNRGLFLNNASIAGNSSAEIVVNELARSIVNEIRTRGPFLSLADFINRPITPSTELAGIKGALQAGIDNMDPATAQVNPNILINSLGGLPSVPPAGSAILTDYQWDREHFIGGSATSSAEVNRGRWAMSPLTLTQADILSSLGPMLSARSDTFIIRTYGETVNPSTGDTDGRAWCEAVVQRLPDYAGGEAAETPPADLTTPDSLSFGRKFKVVSFRWLSPSDI